MRIIAENLKLTPTAWLLVMSTLAPLTSEEKPQQALPINQQKSRKPLYNSVREGSNTEALWRLTGKIYFKKDTWSMTTKPLLGLNTLTGRKQTITN